MSLSPIANPLVILREEFDDWAILFDPDTAEGYPINPVGVFIWKRLDGGHSVEEIATELKNAAENAPEMEVVLGDSQEFIDDLIKHGLAGFEYSPISADVA